MWGIWGPHKTLEDPSRPSKNSNLALFCMVKTYKALWDLIMPYHALWHESTQHMTTPQNHRTSQHHKSQHITTLTNTTQHGTENHHTPRHQTSQQWAGKPHYSPTCLLFQNLDKLCFNETRSPTYDSTTMSSWRFVVGVRLRFAVW